MEFKNFTSLSPAEEQTFVVYEKTSVEAGNKALVTGLTVGGILFVFIVGLVWLVPVTPSGHAQKDKTSTIGAEAPAAAPAPAPTPAPAPAAVADPATATDPAAVPAADPAAVPATTDPAAAPAAAAPAPAEGTTKAPPTAVVGQ